MRLPKFIDRPRERGKCTNTLPHKPADETCFVSGRLFSKKKAASPFLYCLNNLAPPELWISSLSPPCSTFRNSLRPFINITYKSTRLPLPLVSIWCLILFYIQTHLVGFCSFPLFHFSLSRLHCFSWLFSFGINWSIHPAHRPIASCRPVHA